MKVRAHSPLGVLATFLFAAACGHSAASGSVAGAGGARSAGGATSEGGTGATHVSGGSGALGLNAATAGAAQAAGGGSGAGGANSIGASAGSTSAGGASADSRGAGGAVSYTTDFNGTESPIAESGAWTHLGQDWTLVHTANGLAFGTQTGSGGFDDSYAYLSGFPPKQMASGVIHLDAAIDTSTTHEVEILLRWADAAHNAHGYECNLAFNGSYAQIVRWNGKVGDFTYLASGSVPNGVHEGDTLSASAVGNVITLFVNGTKVASATDATWPIGNPGLGFWRGAPNGAFAGDYAFTKYTATSIGQ